MTPWPAAYQAPPSMGFSRQEYWSGVPLSSLKHTLISYKNPKADDETQKLETSQQRKVKE